MVTIIDYGVGNLFSLKSSFSFIGESATVTGDEEEIAKAEKLILPGVGAFKDAAEKLRARGLDLIIKKKAKEGTPLLGICLGMQLLFEKSYEYGEHEGLGLIPGAVRPIKAPGLKIPHIGWNSLHFLKEHPVFGRIKEGDFMYFVHSYCAETDKDNLICTAEYGEDVAAAVCAGSVIGCQFHPEKSGEKGLDILRGFCEWEGV